jgi:hypothetical protein
LTFSVSNPGIYAIAFGASTQEESAGNVAIADVQLEREVAAQTPSRYIETNDSLYVQAMSCTPSASDLRAAFVHNCNTQSQCYYDLTTPLIVDTQTLNGGGNPPLSGKLARGNYNYRHVDVAVNLVGTGLRDCTSNPTPDCYGTGYVEYDLAHDGRNAGISDYNGNTRYFDFGVASIQHGKALAAERYMTVPLGANDQGLISQPGIQHIEFQGRPLDGVYRLRIWDSPALQWQQLQDIQVVLSYEYWSQIVANGSGTAN